MSEATTKNSTPVPGLQQQEGVWEVHGLGGAIPMLVGTTLDASAGTRPSAEAVQEAKACAETVVFSRHPRLRELCTSPQAYAELGAGAGANAGKVGPGVGVRTGGVGVTGGGGGRLRDAVPFSTAVGNGVCRGLGGGGGVASVTTGVAVGTGGAPVTAGVAIGVLVTAGVTAGVIAGLAVAIGVAIGVLVEVGV